MHNQMYPQAHTSCSISFLTARDLTKANSALKDLLEPGRVSVIPMDNNSLESVREAARIILEKSGNQVNILIANAGVMGIPSLQRTEDGHEATFQTNYWSNFLLFDLLKPVLLASVTPSFHSRVVIVSSAASRSVLLPASDDYDFQKTEYSWERAYAASNLAKIYLANSIDRRYGAMGLHATSLHPGAINTNVARHIGPEFVEKLIANPYVAKILKSTEQGAATTVIAVIGKEWESKGGKYLEDCEESKRGEDDWQTFGAGWVKQTYDQKEEDRLWQDSLRILGLKDTN